MSNLCILELNLLLVSSFENIFSHSVGCLFLYCEKLLSLIRSHLVIFGFVSITLGNVSKKNISQWFMSKNVLSEFFSRSFIVSSLTFRSLTHFEFIVLYGVSCCCYSITSNSLQLHGLQHNRLPCPSPSPRVCSNSCPLSQWCRPTISSCVVPFSSYLQSFPASGFFSLNQHFAPGGQSTGASASVSVLPMNIQNWFPYGLTGLISLQSMGLSNTTVQKHQFFSTQLS